MVRMKSVSEICEIDDSRIGWLHAEGVRVGGVEVRQEVAAEGVGDLQRPAQHHRAQEEDDHLHALEQDERVEPERLRDRCACRSPRDGGQAGIEKP